MEHRITHACGHEQDHHLPGFAAQQERKTRWLRTTLCRACFLAGTRTAEAEAAARHEAAIAVLALADLAGSERQVGWASGIRATRLAALAAERGLGGLAGLPCLAIVEARWWIDHRDLSDDELLVAAIAGSAAPGLMGSKQQHAAAA